MSSTPKKKKRGKNGKKPAEGKSTLTKVRGTSSANSSVTITDSSPSRLLFKKKRRRGKRGLRRRRSNLLNKSVSLESGGFPIADSGCNNYERIEPNYLSLDTNQATGLSDGCTKQIGEATSVQTASREVCSSAGHTPQLNHSVEILYSNTKSVVPKKPDKSVSVVHLGDRVNTGTSSPVELSAIPSLTEIVNVLNNDDGVSICKQPVQCSKTASYCDLISSDDSVDCVTSLSNDSLSENDTVSDSFACTGNAKQLCDMDPLFSRNQCNYPSSNNAIPNKPFDGATSTECCTTKGAFDIHETESNRENATGEEELIANEISESANNSSIEVVVDLTDNTPNVTAENSNALTQSSCINDSIEITVISENDERTNGKPASLVTDYYKGLQAVLHGIENTCTMNKTTADVWQEHTSCFEDFGQESAVHQDDIRAATPEIPSKRPQLIKNSKKSKRRRIGESDTSTATRQYDGSLVANRRRTALTTSSRTFTIVSWNLDGLHNVALTRRTRAVAKVITDENPDVVFLQEVIASSLSELQSKLPQYQFVDSDSSDYFTTTLLRRDSMRHLWHEVVPFFDTTMDRTLLVCEAQYGAAKLKLLNTHLESMAQSSPERVRQLACAFRMMQGVPDTHTVIFGGDLNLRDKEIFSVGGIPPGVQDLWTACGAPMNCQYSWDMSMNTNHTDFGDRRPRCRFDRLYVQHSTPPFLDPRRFSFIGQNWVPSVQMFPSDHWGIRVDFDVLSQPKEVVDLT